MNLGRHVFKDGKNLVNLTTKKVVPSDASEKELSDGFFLQGQETQSIEAALFKDDPIVFEIKIVPTWECNLRCKHCFVLHELLKEDKGNLNADALVEFIAAFVQSTPTLRRGNIQFIGGEPALRARQNVELIKAIRQKCNEIAFPIRFSATSNALELNDDIFEFYSLLDSLAISVDGTEKTHNEQRKSSRHTNPYQRTLSNIRKIVAAGLREKLSTQAALGESSFNEECILSYFKTMLMSGVKYENIHFGVTVPTRQSPEPESKFLQAVTDKIYFRPCCKFRLAGDFVVDSSNNIYCDYFDTTENNLVGRLGDPINVINELHKKVIKKNMPVLNDEKCMSCPVIGACWGWCCNLTGLIRPSEHCDQKGLIEKINQKSKNEDLISYLRIPTPECRNA